MRDAPRDPPRRALVFKLCLAGDAGVGKTSLVKRFVSDTFSDGYIATLGAKVSSRQFALPDPLVPGSVREVRATIWDIMGQRGVLDLLSDAFYLNAGGILFVADATRPETLQDLAAWSNVVASVAGSVPGIVLVNKMDLGPQIRIQAEEIEKFCRDLGWTWVPTSAKTGVGVEDAFRDVATSYLRSLSVPASPTGAVHLR